MKKRIALLSLIAIVAISALIFIIVNTNKESEIVSSSNKSETADINEEAENKILTFKEFLGESDVEVTKIEIINGNNGNAVSLTDEEEINHLVEFLNDLQFKDINKKNEEEGWEYRFNVCLSNDKYISILPKRDKWAINRQFYEVSKSQNSKYSIGEELQKIKSRVEE